MSMRLSEPILNRFFALKENIFASWKSRPRTAAWEDKRLLWGLQLCDNSSCFIMIDANLQPSYFKYLEWHFSITKQDALVRIETST